MKSKKTSIELKDSHSLDEAMRAFSKDSRLDLLAAGLGISANVLRNKLNPDQEFHKLSLNETVLLTAKTGNLNLFRAALGMLGYDAHEKAHNTTEDKLIHLLFSTVTSTGNIANLFDKANQDQHIDANEARELISATDNAIKTLQELRANLAAKAA